MAIIEGINRDNALEILKTPTPEHIKKAYNTPYKISESQIHNYRENGFIRLEKVLDGEPLAYAKKVFEAAVFIRKEEDERTLAEKSQYEQSFLQCGYLAFDFPAAKDFVFGKRFAQIAKELMEIDKTRLWHDQALFKEPHGRVTDVHQDSSYWPLSKPELTTTMWMALVDVPIERGCLYFHPGTHKTGIKEYVDIFNNPHQPETLSDNDKTYLPLEAGDASYHSGLVFHGAGENKTDDLREGMTIIYFADGVAFDDSDERNKTHKSCAGLKSGEEVDTEFTPILS